MPPPGRVQLLVARAHRAQLELLDAVAGEARMRMAVDEPRQSAETPAVELFDFAVERFRRSRILPVAAMRPDSQRR